MPTDNAPLPLGGQGGRLAGRSALIQCPSPPWGERVARDGAFISRRGPGEGVPAGPLIVNNSVGQDTIGEMDGG